MENQIEIWKDIPGYEGLYQVSNLGNVKSLDRIVFNKGNKSLQKIKGKNLSKGTSKEKYFKVNLSKEGKLKSFTVHHLVAITFLGHIPSHNKLVVNHIDFNRRNNNIKNLEIITIRENSNRKHLKSSSKYVGVSFNKKIKKWSSYIVIQRKLYSLGYYELEIEASNAYNFALKEWNEKGILPDLPKKTSKHKCICFVSSKQKWNLSIMKNGKRVNYGYFNTEQEAYIKKKDIQNV